MSDPLSTLLALIVLTSAGLIIISLGDVDQQVFSARCEAGVSRSGVEDPDRHWAEWYEAKLVIYRQLAEQRIGVQQLPRTRQRPIRASSLPIGVPSPAEAWDMAAFSFVGTVRSQSILVQHDSINQFEYATIVTILEDDEGYTTRIVPFGLSDTCDKRQAGDYRLYSNPDDPILAPGRRYAVLVWEVSAPAGGHFVVPGYVFEVGPGGRLIPLVADPHVELLRGVPADEFLSGGGVH